MSSKAKAVTRAHSTKFSDLDGSGKIVFVGKVLVFLISFGFAFPTIFGD